MSRAHFAHKNMDWGQMLKLLCYSTEKPELLSKKQLLTRLYKNILRCDYDYIHRSMLVVPTRECFARQIQAHRTEFERMMKMDRHSQEFQDLLRKYEKHIDDNYDPTALIYDNVLHSLNSNKLYIFTDEVRSIGTYVRSIWLLQSTQLVLT